MSKGENDVSDFVFPNAVVLNAFLDSIFSSSDQSLEAMIRIYNLYNPHSRQSRQSQLNRAQIF